MHQTKAIFSAADRRRAGRTIWALLTFMIISIAIIAGVSVLYLIPALQAFDRADPREKKMLAAQALLVMLAVLLMLGCLLILTFRVGRFFFPGPSVQRTKTRYVDAWTESGRRMQTPPEETEGESK